MLKGLVLGAALAVAWAATAHAADELSPANMRILQYCSTQVGVPIDGTGNWRNMTPDQLIAVTTCSYMHDFKGWRSRGEAMLNDKCGALTNPQTFALCAREAGFGYDQTYGIWVASPSMVRGVAEPKLPVPGN